MTGYESESESISLDYRMVSQIACYLFCDDAKLCYFQGSMTLCCSDAYYELKPRTISSLSHTKTLLTQAPVFFEFIQTYTSVETPSQSFRFQWFLTTLPFAKQDKNRLWATLLQTQQNLVNECFDRIRCGATLDSLQAFVPKALKTADLGDPKRWSLGLMHASFVQLVRQSVVLSLRFMYLLIFKTQ